MTPQERFVAIRERLIAQPGSDVAWLLGIAEAAQTMARMFDRYLDGEASANNARAALCAYDAALKGTTPWPSP